MKAKKKEVGQKSEARHGGGCMFIAQSGAQTWSRKQEYNKNNLNINNYNNDVVVVIIIIIKATYIIASNTPHSPRVHRQSDLHLADNLRVILTAGQR